MLTLPVLSQAAEDFARVLERKANKLGISQHTERTHLVRDGHANETAAQEDAQRKLAPHDGHTAPSLPVAAGLDAGLGASHQS